MQSPLINVEGTPTSFRCAPPDTVLRAALRQGIGFPYECSSGGCGTCSYELLSGAVEELWAAAPGLSERARQRGRRLACQTRAAGECRIKVRLSPDYVAKISPGSIEAKLRQVRKLTADMAEFVFQADQPAAFLPGQYALLRIAGVEAARVYSMSNLPNAEGEWRFIIKQVPNGAVTAQLFGALSPGDRVELDGPYGMSYLRGESRRDIVCVAGGSGLSPVLSILRGAAADPSFADRRLILFYGGRGPADLCADSELAADPLLRGRVVLHTAISDAAAPGAEAWSGARGFIHERVRDVLGAALPDYEFYFCGPPPMTDAVHRLLLLDHKLPAAQLHFDRFL